MLRVPRSQRGGDVIEPLISEQWFVKMDTLAAPALDALTRGELRIIPSRFEKIYVSWLTSIQDWCISRQLWWGHRIPVWYVHPNAAAAVAATLDGAKGATDTFVVAHNEAEARAQAYAAHGPSVALVQETDVLDTWFSSGLWPFSTLGWPADTPELARFYPTTMLETGHDILFFWVARMVMLGLALTGKVPFRCLCLICLSRLVSDFGDSTVFLHGLVRDESGRKMSKSLGNVVDPLDVVVTHGADALRFALATGSSPGQDVNLSTERLGSARGLTNKMWNAGRLVLRSIDALSPSQRSALADASFITESTLAALPLAERWIVSRLHDTATRVHAAHGRSDLGEAGRVVADFFWTELADWYLEACKTRFVEGREEDAAITQTVLVYTFSAVLCLAHPFMPFVTEELWQALPHRGSALIAASPPPSGAPSDGGAIACFGILQAAVRAVRNVRSSYGVEPARRIAAIFVAPSESLRDELASEAAVLVLLARLDPSHLEFVAIPPPELSNDSAVSLLVTEGLTVLLPVAGLADPVKERERLDKQAARLAIELDTVQTRLSSPGFADRAPAIVVAKTRDAAEQLRAQLASVHSKIDAMRQTF